MVYATRGACLTVHNYLLHRSPSFKASSSDDVVLTATRVASCHWLVIDAACNRHVTTVIFVRLFPLWPQQTYLVRGPSVHLTRPVYIHRHHEARCVLFTSNRSFYDDTRRHQAKWVCVVCVLHNKTVVLSIYIYPSASRASILRMFMLINMASTIILYITHQVERRRGGTQRKERNPSNTYEYLSFSIALAGKDNLVTLLFNLPT